MDAERWRRVETLFHEALEREEPARSLFLDEQCQSDPELRREVDRWLVADQDAPAHLAVAVGNAVRSFRTAFAPGARIGPYEIVGLEGEGGMGSVYRARRIDDVFQKEVAIKVVKRGMDSGVLVDRFRRERQILARLEHPNIARVLDGGSTDEGLPYLVMEYVDGKNLLDYADDQHLDVTSRLRLFSQVCEAVANAHQHQIVHRDLKPNNILVDADGRPRLLDFGIAKLASPDEPGTRRDLTSTGGFGILTPRYASPEHVKGEPITVSSDVYSLGVILYELLTGCAVHRATGASPAEILKAICKDEVAPPSRAAAAQQSRASVPIAPHVLEGDLDRIVLMALDKDPRQRYPSVDALAADIQRYLASQPVEARASTGGYRARRLVRRHRIALAVFGLAALAAAVALRALWRPSGRAQAEAPVQKVMLAVLPLENLTGNQERDYFVDGLHEEIVSRLGQLQPARLGVIARTSTLQYKGTTKSIATIGEELHSQYVLEGSVRQAGRRLRVTAQLIKVSDQAHVWAETFERELEDLFSVQSEIAARVADRLAVDVLPVALATLQPHQQLGPDIHALFLRGQYLYERRSIDPANPHRALDCFRQVVEAAPDFAEGHSALGRTYRYLAFFALPEEKPALLDKAKAELIKALSMNRRLADAHSVLSGIRLANDWDWRAAEEAAREAVKLDPNSASAHGALALSLSFTRQMEEADREIRLAQELSPLEPIMFEWAFYIHLAGRRWESAEAAARKLAELVPGNSTPAYMTSQLLTLRGDCQGALRELAKVDGLPEEPPAGIDGYGLSYVFGRCAPHDKVARQLTAMEKQPRNYAYTIATAHAAAGNRAKAIEWLEESYRRREETMVFVAVDPMLDVVQSEPRFGALLEKMHLPRN
jgi:TolB-like protein/tRNA A-37 threonylcarbamoyl transferase component Bud32